MTGPLLSSGPCPVCGRQLYRAGTHRLTHVCPGAPEWTARVSHQDEPVRARKTAGLCLEDGQLRFCGFTVGGTYGADATATHEVYARFLKPHASPDPTGRCPLCGFYALRDFDMPAQVVLDVELFGTIVAHAKGWRASRQRVLVCWVRRTCVCGRLASGVGVQSPSVDHPKERVRVRPTCHACAVSVMPLVDVAGELGCEVRWKPPSGLPLVASRHEGDAHG